VNKEFRDAPAVENAEFAKTEEALSTKRENARRQTDLESRAKSLNVRHRNRKTQKSGFLAIPSAEPLNCVGQNAFLKCARRKKELHTESQGQTKKRQRGEVG
jgi:hypothetical protein